MDRDIQRPGSVIDAEALKNRLEAELGTVAPEETVRAMVHALDCVCGQLIRAARHGIKQHVAQLIADDAFDGIPDLHPSHFLRTYQGSSDSPYPAGSGYSGRAPRQAQEVTSHDDAPEVATELR